MTRVTAGYLDTIFRILVFVEGEFVSTASAGVDVVPSLEEVGSEAPRCSLVVTRVSAVVVVSNSVTMVISVRMGPVALPVLTSVALLSSCECTPVLVPITSVALEIPHTFRNRTVFPLHFRIVSVTPGFTFLFGVRVCAVCVVSYFWVLRLHPVLTPAAVDGGVVETRRNVLLSSVFVTERIVDV